MSVGLIPCSHQDLWVKYTNIKNLIPASYKEACASIVANGGEIYDPWFKEAEKVIARDLRKFQTPVELSQVSNLSDLTQLKAYKTLELLFRSDFLEEKDKFKILADHYASEYAEELLGLPLDLGGGENYTLGGGIVRRT